MRWPRRVDLEPDRVAGPDAGTGRSSGWAFITIGFWPVIMDQVARRGVDRLRVRQRLAEADVDDDLLELRHLVAGSRTRTA